jgi:hypothetical protein
MTLFALLRSQEVLDIRKVVYLKEEVMSESALAYLEIVIK